MNKSGLKNLIAQALLSAALMCAIAFHAQAGATVASVGTQGNCDFTNLNSALVVLLDGGADHVRLHLQGNKTFSAQPMLNQNVRVELIGGFANCADDEPTSNQMSTIDGNSGQSASLIGMFSNGNQNGHLVLQNLIIQNQLTSAVGGGISVAGEDTLLQMDNVLLQQNIGFFGGGLAVLNGARAFLKDVRVVSNTARNNTGSAFGGGVYCDGAGSQITIQGQTSVVSNAAISDAASTTFGGGLAVTHGCALFSVSADTFRIELNHAVQGGGLYLLDANAVIVSGAASTARIRIQNNRLTASENQDFPSGGGVYVSGENALLRLGNAEIGENRINGSSGFFPRGGGLHVSDGAEVFLDRVHFHDNNAQHGSAFEVDSAFLEGVNLRIFGHAETTPFNDFSLIELGNSPLLAGNTEVILEGLLVHNNAVPNVFHLAGSAIDLNVAHMTVAGNDENLDAVFNRSSGASTLPAIELYNSVIDHDPSDAVFKYNGRAQSMDISPDCLLVNRAPGAGDQSFAGARGFLVSDTALIRPPLGLYQPSTESLAIDYCNTAQYQPFEEDQQGDVRGSDFPNVPAFIGDVDLGYDEVVLPDLIHRNGFDPAL